jgi:hypothetical protein
MRQARARARRGRGCASPARQAGASPARARRLARTPARQAGASPAPGAGEQASRPDARGTHPRTDKCSRHLPGAWLQGRAGRPACCVPRLDGSADTGASAPDSPPMTEPCGPVSTPACGPATRAHAGPTRPRAPRPRTPCQPEAPGPTRTTQRSGTWLRRRARHPHRVRDPQAEDLPAQRRRSASVPGRRPSCASAAPSESLPS